MINKEKTMGDFVIEKTISGTILAITSATGRRVQLNDEVIIRKKEYASESLRGRVIQIFTPYQGGVSSNVIGCLMNTQELDDFIVGTMANLKFEDLEPQTA